jgi:hypothetical protein
LFLPICKCTRDLLKLTSPALTARFGFTQPLIRAKLRSFEERLCLAEKIILATPLSDCYLCEIAMLASILISKRRSA